MLLPARRSQCQSLSRNQRTCVSRVSANGKSIQTTFNPPPSALSTSLRNGLDGPHEAATPWHRHRHCHCQLQRPSPVQLPARRQRHPPPPPYRTSATIQKLYRIRCTVLMQALHRTSRPILVQDIARCWKNMHEPLAPSRRARNRSLYSVSTLPVCCLQRKKKNGMSVMGDRIVETRPHRPATLTQRLCRRASQRHLLHRRTNVAGHRCTVHRMKS